jgi:hypothetical protein
VNNSRKKSAKNVENNREWTRMKREDRRTAAPKFSGVKWTQIYADRNPWSAASLLSLEVRLSRTKEDARPIGSRLGRRR